MTSRPAPNRPLFRAAGVLADRIGTSVRQRSAESRLGRAMGAGEVIYLVAPAGHPNYGDELIARTWLRHLTRVRPNATIVLDCHSPGTATTLLRDAHPNMLVVDTLWQLTTYAAEAEQPVPWEWVTAAALDLGLHINIVQLPGLGGVIRMAPPLTISETELHDGVDKLEQAIAGAVAQ